MLRKNAAVIWLDCVSMKKRDGRSTKPRVWFR